MKKRVWIIGVVVLLLAALVVVLLRDKIFRRSTGSGDADAGTSVESNNFPLKYGSRGERVRKVQAYVNQIFALAPVSRDYMPLSEDGIFGVKTEAACELFLNTKEITEDWYKTHIQ